MFGARGPATPCQPVLVKVLCAANYAPKYEGAPRPLPPSRTLPAAIRRLLRLNHVTLVWSKPHPQSQLFPSNNNFTQALLVLLVTNTISADNDDDDKHPLLIVDDDDVEESAHHAGGDEWSKGWWPSSDWWFLPIMCCIVLLLPPIKPNGPSCLSYLSKHIPPQPNRDPT